MPRIARMLIQEKESAYHVMSRTALPGFPLEDVEKDFLLNLIKELSKVFFSEILGCCLMGNHFHLLVRMHPDSNYADGEIIKRYKLYYGKDKVTPEGKIGLFREKWSSLSEFVKEIKQTFTRYYNKRHERRGYFWGERFKSLIVENGDTLVNCLAYIDLNPVRAGIVSKPEDYRWNSIGYHVQTGNKDRFLSLDLGMKEFGVKGKTERLRLYRKFVYETGAVDVTGNKVKIKEEVVEKERRKGFQLTRADLFKHRTRYFTDSGIIGSKEFVRENFQRFKHLFQSKNERNPRHVIGLDGIYSLKRLTSN
jgi:putative transposase